MSTKLFVSYSWRDKAQVHAYANELGRRGHRLYLDERENVAGEPLMGLLRSALADATAFVVFVGAGGLGRIQRDEVIVAMYRRHVDGVKVVPVLMSGDKAPDVFEGLLSVRSTYGDVPATVGDIEEALVEVGAARKAADPRPVPWAEAFELPAEADRTMAALAGLRSDDDAAKALGRQFRSWGSPPAFVLGGRYPESDGGWPPSSSQFSRDLLVRLKVVKEDYAEILPPLHGSGAYYHYGRPQKLEPLAELLTNEIRIRSSMVPETFRKVAQTAAYWSGRERRKSFDARPVVIVTTNHDTLIERALFEEGLPFTRFVQRYGEPGAFLNEFSSFTIDQGRTVLARERTLPVEERDRIGEDFENVLRGTAKAIDAQAVLAHRLCRTGDGGPIPESFVVLVKYHGSCDMLDTCAISTPQLHQLATRKCVPDSVVSALERSPIVIAGYRMVDANIHHLWATWMGDLAKRGQLERVWVQPSIDRDDSDSMQARIEERIFVDLLQNCQQFFHATPVIADPAAFLGLVLSHSTELG